MSEKAHVVVAQCLCCKILLKMDGFFFFSNFTKTFSPLQGALIAKWWLQNVHVSKRCKMVVGSFGVVTSNDL